MSSNYAYTKFLTQDDKDFVRTVMEHAALFCRENVFNDEMRSQYCDLNKYLCISPGIERSIMRGECTYLPYFIRICHALGYTLDEMFGFKKTEPKPEPVQEQITDKVLFKNRVERAMMTKLLRDLAEVIKDHFSWLKEED